MDDLIIFISGGLAVLWSWLILEHLDRPHKVQDSKQKLLEPWQVADQWYKHISGDK
ncbi:hypothetical protein IV73_GL000135 [Weissella kandleri]|uniref:Uncharacterized protein n=1 Tax=Weissella kandleri TaxID=1616 RepID=A0A0R2JNP8_9LACO|nr:hypothetical protein [Weissella kandleri]KRN75645.1 hypothetical protein IV73_GL000135 [Weissella kandleri]